MKTHIRHCLIDSAMLFVYLLAFMLVSRASYLYFGYGPTMFFSPLHDMPPVFHASGDSLGNRWTDDVPTKQPTIPFTIQWTMQWVEKKSGILMKEISLHGYTKQQLVVKCVGEDEQIY